jgi:hypothetical protein
MVTSSTRASLLIASVLAFGSLAHAEIRTSTRGPRAPTAISVIVDYQRVGHDLLDLQAQRGLFDCGDLASRFRAIKLDTALATPASRAAAATTLAEIATKIVRLRGVQVEEACLHNPLAAGCT